MTDFLCIKDVIMSDDSIAFTQGNVYSFIEGYNGDIHRFTENNMHTFSAKGCNGWGQWFERVNLIEGVCDEI